MEPQIWNNEMEPIKRTRENRTYKVERPKRKHPGGTIKVEPPNWDKPSRTTRDHRKWNLPKVNEVEPPKHTKQDKTNL